MGILKTALVNKTWWRNIADQENLHNQLAIIEAFAGVDIQYVGKARGNNNKGKFLATVRDVKTKRTIDVLLSPNDGKASFLFSPTNTSKTFRELQSELLNPSPPTEGEKHVNSIELESHSDEDEQLIVSETQPNNVAGNEPEGTHSEYIDTLAKKYRTSEEMIEKLLPHIYAFPFLDAWVKADQDEALVLHSVKPIHDVNGMVASLQLFLTTPSQINYWGDAAGKVQLDINSVGKFLAPSYHETLSLLEIPRVHFNEIVGGMYNVASRLSRNPYMMEDAGRFIERYKLDPYSAAVLAYSGSKFFEEIVDTVTNSIEEGSHTSLRGLKIDEDDQLNLLIHRQGFNPLEINVSKGGRINVERSSNYEEDGGNNADYENLISVVESRAGQRRDTMNLLLENESQDIRSLRTLYESLNDAGENYSIWVSTIEPNSDRPGDFILSLFDSRAKRGSRKPIVHWTNEGDFWTNEHLRMWDENYNALRFMKTLGVSLGIQGEAGVDQVLGVRRSEQESHHVLEVCSDDKSDDMGGWDWRQAYDDIQETFPDLFRGYVLKIAGSEEATRALFAAQEMMASDGVGIANVSTRDDLLVGAPDGAVSIVLDLKDDPDVHNVRIGKNFFDDGTFGGLNPLPSEFKDVVNTMRTAVLEDDVSPDVEGRLERYGSQPSTPYTDAELAESEVVLQKLRSNAGRDNGQVRMDSTSTDAMLSAEELCEKLDPNYRTGLSDVAKAMPHVWYVMTQIADLLDQLDASLWDVVAMTMLDAEVQSAAIALLGDRASQVRIEIGSDGHFGVNKEKLSTRDKALPKIIDAAETALLEYVAGDELDWKVAADEIVKRTRLSEAQAKYAARRPEVKEAINAALPEMDGTNIIMKHIFPKQSGLGVERISKIIFNSKDGSLGRAVLEIGNRGHFNQDFSDVSCKDDLHGIRRAVRNVARSYRPKDKSAQHVTTCEF